MKRNKITIADGVVIVPHNPQMTDFEIAELFGVFTRTVRSNIRSILKAGIVTPDFSTGIVVRGTVATPDFYGLEMILSLAFRISSPRAKVLREHLIRRSTVAKSVPLYLLTNSNAKPC